MTIDDKLQNCVLYEQEEGKCTRVLQNESHMRLTNW